MNQRTTQIESYKNSLRHSLTTEIESLGFYCSDDFLRRAAFLCCAPTHELGEKIKIPKEVDLLIDVPLPCGCCYSRVGFSLHFLRIERDERDDWLAIYEATC